MLNGFLLLIYAVVGHLKQMALFSVPDSMIMQLCLQLPEEGKKKNKKKLGIVSAQRPKVMKSFYLNLSAPASKSLNTTENPMNLPLAYHW